jgi:hypothetical protein
MEHQTDKELKETGGKYTQFPYVQVTSKEIEDAGYDWYMRDSIPSHLSDGVYLLNYDQSSGQGTHWVTLIIQYPEVYIFDPLSVKVNHPPPSDIIKWARDNKFSILYDNEFPIQHKESYLCGYYSLLMADAFVPMVGHLTERVFDQKIKSLFDTHPTKHNVNKVMKYSHKEGLI